MSKQESPMESARIPRLLVRILLKHFLVSTPRSLGLGWNSSLRWSGSFPSIRHHDAHYVIDQCKDQREDNMPRLMRFAQECFNHQHRLFLFMISVDGHLARFIRTDRSTSLVSEPFDYVKDPTSLWRFVYAFSKASAWQRGHDPTASLATSSEAELFRNLSRTYPEASRNAALHYRLEHAATPGWPVYVLDI